jgi:DNA polymerase III subunit epsilon
MGAPNLAADKESAAQWARQLLAREDWVILDTETTGLHDAEVVDIAIVNSKGEPIVDTLICPTISIPQEVSDIHGLFDADVADAPTFPEIYTNVLSAIARKEVVIYNADFDTRILTGMCRLHGLKTPFLPFVPPVRVSCAMKAYAMWVGEWSDRRGSYRWQKLDGGNHRALGDCLATLQLIQKMAGIS